MPIIYDEKKRVFKLDTPNTTYAFHVTNSNHLLHLYYGASIPETDLTHMLRIPNDEPFVPSTHDGMGPHSFDCAAIEFPTSGGVSLYPADRQADRKGRDYVRLHFQKKITAFY